MRSRWAGAGAVSTNAGSVVLAHPDGTLRATDVGKIVAIPGAADLVATIAALVARKEVKIRPHPYEFPMYFDG